MLAQQYILEDQLIQKLLLEDEILDLQLLGASDTQAKFNILLNRSVLLRVEKRTNIGITKKFQSWAEHTGNLVSSKSQTHIKKIVSLDRQINDKINRSVTRGPGSADNFKDFYASLKRRWEEIAGLEETIGIKVLRRDKLGYCKRCNSFRQANGLVASMTTPLCLHCGTPIASSKHYFSLSGAISQFLSGFWLEYYIAKKLELLGWRTMVGVYVFGTSGVKFEIDVLATKKGKTLLVECKSGSTGQNDLSGFIAKYNEIRTSAALLVSLPKLNVDLHRMATRIGGFHTIDEVTSERGLMRELARV